MSGWVKIPEEWLDSPAIESLPDEAVLFHLSALAYVARQNTNGQVPRNQVRKLWCVESPDSVIAVLVSEGHWIPNALGWHLRDWQTFVLSAEEVDRRRELGRVRQERYRRHSIGDHSMCDRCSFVRAGNASQNASVTTSVTPPPIRTEPNRPVREERGAAPDSAGAPSALPIHPFVADDEGCCPLPSEHPVHG